MTMVIRKSLASRSRVGSIRRVRVVAQKNSFSSGRGRNHQRFLSLARPEQESSWEDAPHMPTIPSTTPTRTLPVNPNAWKPQNIVNGNNKERSFPSRTPMQSSELKYIWDNSIPITTKLNLVTPDQDTPRGTWPAFRLLDESGYFRDPSLDNSNQSQKLVIRTKGDDMDKLRADLISTYPYHQDEFSKSELLRNAKNPHADTDSKNTLLRAHSQMVRLREMDNILLNAQRQGRISFYLTCTGEEAIMIGAASALDRGDPLLVQYREQGMLMWRGFTLEQFCNQCFGNDLDLGKGRQMPIHYGSRALNFHTVSSPLGTQLPQAVGAAYRLKLSKKPNVAVAVFGDGCASTPDFHSALNMAATTKSPTIFICRNNGYAISTSTKEQFAGDGIVSRGPGYGVASLRVDGNDIFAVHAAVRTAKEYALQHEAPVLIECMSYRQGHHSTSDDSTQYRSSEEIESVEPMDPLVRLQAFLLQHGVLSENQMSQVKQEEHQAVLEALHKAEERPKVKWQDVFTDVYAEKTPLLEEQEEELQHHMSKYPEHYGS